MNQQATHFAQVIHRTCASCGHVTHYDASGLCPEQFSALQMLTCNECGHSDAVIMLTDQEAGIRFTLAELPVAPSNCLANSPAGPNRCSQ
jgi:hypothetical protein